MSLTDRPFVPEPPEQMDQTGPSQRRPRHRLLLHGESIVASAGLAIAAILLLATAAAGLWALHLQQGMVRSEREAALRATGDLLVADAAAFLRPAVAGGERLSAKALSLRLAEGVGGLATARCVLVGADGRVLADSTESAPPDAAGAVDDGVRVRIPIDVGDGTAATLELTAAAGRPIWAYWDAQAGLGVVGALALLAFLLVYRGMRRRLRALGAIRDAMLAIRGGETSAGALAVSREFGVEADVWNALLAEREQLRGQLVVERARETMGSRRDLKNDLVQACDAMSQGLALVDEHMKVKYANGAAATFLRTKREQIVGADVAAMIREPAIVEAIRGVAEGTLRRRTVEEVRRSEEEGGGVLRISVRPVRRDDSAAALLTIEDVTQQRVADEARNAFVAQATHELRTPLTNIRLYVEQALEDGENDAALRSQCLNVINQESRRLERIVADMLSVAEIEAGSLKLRRGDVRLESLFEEMEADYKAQAAEKGITLGFDLPPKWPVMEGDRDKITLALHNLVGNALKYTPSGGSVTVRADASDEQLVVEVTDTGIGVSGEESELIFEKFYRAKDKRLSTITGTGLGLALARDVVRLHGGDITVRSQIDQGSTFTVTLPTKAA